MSSSLHTYSFGVELTLHAITVLAIINLAGFNSYNTCRETETEIGPTLKKNCIKIRFVKKLKKPRVGANREIDRKNISRNSW